MAKEPLILTIDIGTQSARIGLFNKKGDAVAIEKIQYEPAYISDKKGSAEQDADFYFNVISTGVKRLKKQNPEAFKLAIGVAMDTVRDTHVILDKNYKPLHRCILWLDQRLAEGKKKRPLMHRFLFNAIGMGNTIKLNTQKSISLWYQEQRPDLWKKAKHYGNISTYLTYRLTGKFVDSPASIIGHFPLQFKKQVFEKRENALKNIYGIPLSWLPELVEQGKVLGTITKEAAKLTGIKEGLPLYSCGSDKSCESLGVGAITPHIAAISYGTASSVEVTTKKYYESEPFLPAYPSVIRGFYNMDVQIYRGYWMINWFLKYFCHYNLKTNEEFKNVLIDFNKRLNKVPAGSDGLILQPYWQPGLARPLSKGAVVGFTDTHTSVHFYRAIIEGIAFALREALEHFEHKNHHAVREVMISGGGSQSDEICQITADLFGLPVHRVQTFETSSLGCAIAGFIAAGEFKDINEAVDSMVHRSKEFKPNKEQHEIYNKVFYRGYRRMYPCLSKIYKNIR